MGVQGKSSFADISFSVQDLKVERERHYFGSRHGKGPSDGVSGVIKPAVRRAVISRQVIVDNAAAMFSFCQENMTKNDCARQRRVFIYVADGEINRDRQNRAVKTAVAGTRLIHAVKGVQPGVIGIRLLTCFCEGCQDNTTCVNSNFTQPWQRRALKLEIPQPSEDVEVRRSPKILEVGDGGQGEVEVGDIWQSFTKGVVPDDLTETELGDNDPLALMSLLEDVGLEIANENVPPANEVPTHHPATKESVVAVAASNHDNDVPTHLPDTEKSMNITPEKFYAVFYSDPPKWFIGRAMQPANDDRQEQKPDKGSRAYWWPKKRDEEKVPRHLIFYGPLNMSGHHLLMLTEDDDVEINKKFNCLKKIWN